jgi:hypothetical protein
MKCKDCKIGKVLSYNIKRGDYRCRPCINIEKRAYSAKRKAQGRPLPRGGYDPVKDALYKKKYSRRSEIKERIRLLYHKRKKDPIEHFKMLARWKAKNRVKIDKSCECGKPAVARHHDDYSKPLDVRLLCQNCHEKQPHEMKLSKLAEEKP